MIKILIHQEDITIINTYASYNRDLKHWKQKSCLIFSFLSLSLSLSPSGGITSFRHVPAHSLGSSEHCLLHPEVQVICPSLGFLISITGCQSMPPYLFPGSNFTLPWP